MLTSRQHELLAFIHRRQAEDGVTPSFDEMMEGTDIASKSNIHRLVLALEERGFIRRLPNRARAIEVINLPDSIACASAVNAGRTNPSSLPGQDSAGRRGESGAEIPVMGKIAAGIPVSAIRTRTHSITVPPAMLSGGDHYALEVKDDSMSDEGIFDGDTVIIRDSGNAVPGDIVVAVIDDKEATLKRFGTRDGAIALEAAKQDGNASSCLFDPSRIKVQGRLVGLIRRY